MKRGEGRWTEGRRRRRRDEEPGMGMRKGKERRLLPSRAALRASALPGKSSGKRLSPGNSEI